MRKLGHVVRVQEDGDNGDGAVASEFVPFQIEIKGSRGRDGGEEGVEDREGRDDLGDHFDNQGCRKKRERLGDHLRTSSLPLPRRGISIYTCWLVRPCEEYRNVEWARHHFNDKQVPHYYWTTGKHIQGLLRCLLCCSGPRQ